MKQESSNYAESFTNEQFFINSKNRFETVNAAIRQAKALVLTGKDALNPAYETLKAMADGRELRLPDRPKRVPLEIRDEERGSHRSKKAHVEV